MSAGMVDRVLSSRQRPSHGGDTARGEPRPPREPPPSRSERRRRTDPVEAPADEALEPPRGAQENPSADRQRAADGADGRGAAAGCPGSLPPLQPLEPMEPMGYEDMVRKMVHTSEDERERDPLGGSHGTAPDGGAPAPTGPLARRRSAGDAPAQAKARAPRHAEPDQGAPPQPPRAPARQAAPAAQQALPAAQAHGAAAAAAAPVRRAKSQRLRNRHPASADGRGDLPARRLQAAFGRERSPPPSRTRRGRGRPLPLEMNPRMTAARSGEDASGAGAQPSSAASNSSAPRASAQPSSAASNSSAPPASASRRARVPRGPPSKQSPEEDGSPTNAARRRREELDAKLQRTAEIYGAPKAGRGSGGSAALAAPQQGQGGAQEAPKPAGATEDDDGLDQTLKADASPSAGPSPGHSFHFTATKRPQYALQPLEGQFTPRRSRSRESPPSGTLPDTASTLSLASPCQTLGDADHPAYPGLLAVALARSSSDLGATVRHFADPNGSPAEGEPRTTRPAVWRLDGPPLSARLHGAPAGAQQGLGLAQRSHGGFELTLAPRTAREASPEAAGQQAAHAASSSSARPAPLAATAAHSGGPCAARPRALPEGAAAQARHPLSLPEGALTARAPRGAQPDGGAAEAAAGECEDPRRVKSLSPRRWEPHRSRRPSPFLQLDQVKAALQAGHQLLPHTPASAPSESEHRRLRPFVGRGSAAALRPHTGEDGGEVVAAGSPEPVGRAFSPPVAGLGRLLRTLSDLGTGGGHLSARSGHGGAGVGETQRADAAAAGDSPLLDVLYDPRGNRFREFKHLVPAAPSKP